MGLCKCPQRKVSTLFCFKHHVNVCESCLVNEHVQCVVRSYVSWLQDNDFNPNCSLCNRSLTETDEETIRLVCYDLFHWSCFNEYFRSFPNHTAPDGYTCPTCHTCVFPLANLVSPVADHLRAKLSIVDWANQLPILSLNDSNLNQDKQPLLTETENNGYVIVNPKVSGTNGGTSGLSHHPHRSIDMPPGTTILTTRPFNMDSEDEDKYKRRSVFTWFARWLRSRQPTNRKGSLLTNNRTQMSRTRFTIYMILIILFVFVTIITVSYHLTRGDNNEHLGLINDPQFNPWNNPFIRVGNHLLKNPLKDSDAIINKDQSQ
ncbi:unnamed protein product [Rotaria magnacalcarata]|uniref:RING-type domain-containing protein n=2 Tax=Rotaria magnacalcarata TaxID=392030 RepID=A0A816WX87_9BILA|nr:unnamed protein product [Rotaria magnacalcarata]CAF3922289.1 unnamed protein product [Rotaria magnacalcarata]